jgi:hypothetical protein
MVIVSRRFLIVAITRALAAHWAQRLKQMQAKIERIGAQIRAPMRHPKHASQINMSR